LIRTANTSRINKSKLDEEKACEESPVTFKDYHQNFQQIYLVISIIQAWGDVPCCDGDGKRIDICHWLYERLTGKSYPIIDNDILLLSRIAPQSH
jgi:hypothetical protein